MTDLTKLKDLAERASALHGTPSLEHSAAITEFRNTANPQAILGLIERLEKAEQHWANENSNNMALIAEVERLTEELSACTEHPGGCGYWREAAKRRAEERDRLKAENEALRSALNPFSEFERVRSAMGGNSPKAGILYGVHSSAGDAELHVEHMQAAQAALEGGGR